MAMHMYASKHEGALPWSGGKENEDALLDFRTNYVVDFDSFRCPSDSGNDNFPKNFKDLPPEQRPKIQTRLSSANRSRYDEEFLITLRESYEYLGAYTTAPLTLPHPSRGIPRVPIMWDVFSGFKGLGDERYTTWGGFNQIPGGGNVLWLDGSVEFILAADWPDVNIPYRPQGFSYKNPSDATPPPAEEKVRATSGRPGNGLGRGLSGGRPGAARPHRGRPATPGQ